MFDNFGLILTKLYGMYSNMFLIMAGLAVLFTLIAIFTNQACNPERRWWQSPELPTDICYAVGTTLILPYLSFPAAVLVHLSLCGFMTTPEIEAYFQEGHGPLAGIGFWWQVPIHLVLSDFLAYWLHRGFHGATMWRFHAIHHSSNDVDWHTTYRMHPVNHALSPQLVTVTMLTLGISPQVPAFLIAWEILSAAFVHANLNWTFGPLKYVIAGPVFHRWHHGPADDGGSKNFASTFSFIDWLFGTFHMPEGRLPMKFGVDDPNFPKTYLGQLLYPFKPHAQPEATPSAPVPGSPAA